MIKRYPLKVTNTLRNNLSTALLLLVAQLFTPATATETVSDTIQATPAHRLSPYSAEYNSTINGITAKLKQTLATSDQQHWQLKSEATALFITITEQAQFNTQANTVTPISYRYKNPINSKRSMHLLFDAKGDSVNNTANSEPAFNIPSGALDKISFQSQLRLDLMNDPNFSQKNYNLVDAKKIKTYTVTKIKEENISTPAGTFNAVRFEQRRKGREDYSIIWLAKEHEYFLLRIERIEDGETEFKIELVSAKIEGKAI